MLYKSLLTLLLVATATAEKCGGCDSSACELLKFCPSGATKDVCGCCDVCLKRVGETCDYALDEGVQKVYGECGEFLTCAKGKQEPFKGTCECGVDGAVCGSDGVTYDDLCALIEETANNPDLTVLERVPCKKGPVIKTPPKDARRPLKSILLLDCEAYGFPVPTITWELNKPDGSTVKLPSDDSYIATQVRGGPEKNMATGWVQIMKITKENVGIYTCIATSEEGETRASATVSYKQRQGGKKNQKNRIK